MNIWTHLVAFVAFMGWFGVIFGDDFARVSSRGDRAMLTILVASAEMCFCASTAYHALHCVSERWHMRLYKLDIGGICVLIYGSFVAGLYSGFYCRPLWQWLYLSLLSVMIALTLLLTLVDKYLAPRYAAVRTGVLVCTVAFGVVPAVHWAATAARADAAAVGLRVVAM